MEVTEKTVLSAHHLPTIPEWSSREVIRSKPNKATTLFPIESISMEKSECMFTLIVNLLILFERTCMYYYGIMI